MESIINGFFNSLDSTACPFTYLRTQDREECKRSCTSQIQSSLRRKAFTNLDSQHKLWPELPENLCPLSYHHGLLFSEASETSSMTPIEPASGKAWVYCKKQGNRQIN